MDAILYWNDVANHANQLTHTTEAQAEAGSRGPCGSSRAYAIVHLAMHDAYFGIEKPLERYLAGLPAHAAGAKSSAAISAAAHVTLSALYPAQKADLDARLAARLMTEPDESEPGGVAYGTAVAKALLAARGGDPGLGDAGYFTSTAAGHHRADPDNSPQGVHAPFYGAAAKCFASRARYGIQAPPAPGSFPYRRALREVRGKGIAPALAGTLPASLARRTPDETVIGLFWAYDGVKKLGTPPRFYNLIVRRIAQQKGNDIERNARLFARVNAAMGDAGILAWQAKFDHDLWRPVLGIREHGGLGPAGAGANPVNADADPGWLPLGAPATNETPTDGKPVKKNFTPPFPAYPSGHATFGAAVFQSVRRFYEDEGEDPDTLLDGMVFVSEELDGVSHDNTGTVTTRTPRTFPGGLAQMIEENGRSRVYLGVHWVFDAFAVDGNGKPDLDRPMGGVPLGLAIANDIAENGLSAAAAVAAPPGPADVLAAPGA